jgi:hypothetical protein
VRTLRELLVFAARFVHEPVELPPSVTCVESGCAEHITKRPCREAQGTERQLFPISAIGRSYNDRHVGAQGANATRFLGAQLAERRRRKNGDGLAGDGLPGRESTIVEQDSPFGWGISESQRVSRRPAKASAGSDQSHH